MEDMFEWAGHDMGRAWWEQQDRRKLCQYGLCHLQVCQLVVYYDDNSDAVNDDLHCISYRAGELGLRLVIPLTNGWNMANGQHLMMETNKMTKQRSSFKVEFLTSSAGEVSPILAWAANTILLPKKVSKSGQGPILQSSTTLL